MYFKKKKVGMREPFHVSASSLYTDKVHNAMGRKYVCKDSI